jgi:hypothetical protein
VSDSQIFVAFSQFTPVIYSPNCHWEPSGQEAAQFPSPDRSQIIVPVIAQKRGVPAQSHAAVAGFFDSHFDTLELMVCMPNQAGHKLRTIVAQFGGINATHRVAANGCLSGKRCNRRIAVSVHSVTTDISRISIWLRSENLTINLPRE